MQFLDILCINMFEFVFVFKKTFDFDELDAFFEIMSVTYPINENINE